MAKNRVFQYKSDKYTVHRLSGSVEYPPATAANKWQSRKVFLVVFQLVKKPSSSII